MLIITPLKTNMTSCKTNHETEDVSPIKNYIGDLAACHLLSKVIHGHRRIGKANQFYCKLGGSSHLVSSTEPWLVVIPQSRGTSLVVHGLSLPS